MAEVPFVDYLITAPPEVRPFLASLHESLLEEGYKPKFEQKANGPFLSYAHPKTKRSLVNLLSRKTGPQVRIYADYLAQYADLIAGLPEGMERQIAKASNCRGLLNPGDCNSRCPKGYAFSVRESEYVKCRYNCFQFTVDQASIPVLEDFIARERQGRRG